MWLEDFGDVTNLGYPGAGNEYIAESTIYELLNCNYDCVLIMWSGLQRVDLRVDKLAVVDDICPLEDITYKPIGDLLGSPKYREIFVVGNELTRGYKSLMEMIKLQNYLKNNNVKYYFMSYVNYWNDAEQLPNRNFGVYKYPLTSKLANSLDFSRFIFANDSKDCLYELACKTDGGLAEDNFHPSGKALDEFMLTAVIPRLQQDGVINHGV